jgi:chromosome segregation protein
LRIKEIELDNFKSFGKSTLVPLLDGFTTISGPNGSGKSNIIDSLLFALGLSSTRSMRAERLPDLLNNLSGRKDAKVRVKFVSPDNEEIEVTRRIKVKEDLSYTSSYLLNGKGSTLTEIHDRLGRHNVSPTGFNVIMQGDVTGIVTMSATERRKIIDELAGVADFDRRIDQAQTELTSVAEKIDHQRIVLTEIIARLEVLRTDRDQALKYLDLKTKKETIERDLIFVRALELEERAKQELAEIERLEGKESELADKLHQTEINLLSLRSEMGKIDEEIKEKGGNEQLLLRQELENKRGELTREENKLSNLQGAIGEKEKSLKNFGEQVKTIEKHLSKLAKQKKQHIEDKKNVELVLMERQGAYSAVMSEIEVYRQEKDKAGEKVSDLHSDLQKLRDENHKLSIKKTELETRRKGLEKELEGLRSQATEKITRSASLKNAMSYVHKKFVDQEALVLGIDRSIEQLEAELDSTHEEIESKSHGLQTVQKRIIELETQKEVAGESGYGRAVEAILASNIRGVHGTIGQLGSVDEEYQTALETCLGGRLTHVVVEDDQVAQECIQYLKSTNAGRATFVPLNKIVAQPPGLLPDRAGVIDFAYNLVDFEQRFTKAFQYACGSTIVVDDINNARRMISQARMVTLEGELFEKSGSITGGREKKSQFHFSSKGETDLGVLKQTAKNLADQVKWLKDSVKDLTQQLSDERKKQNEARGELAKRKADIDNHRQQSDDLDSAIESIKPQLRTKGDEIDVIDQDVVTIDESVKELSNRIASLEQSLDGIRDKGKQSQIEKLITESEECLADLKAVDSEFQEFQKLIDRIETEEKVETNNLESLVKQVEVVQQEINEVSVQKPIHEELIAALNVSIVEMERKVSEISEELESLRAHKDKIHEDVTAAEIAKTKLDQEVIRIIEQRKQRQMAHFDVTRELASVKQEIAAVLETNPNYEPPNSKTVEELKRECDRLEKRMRALEPVNMKALEDYNTTEQRQMELDENLAILESEKLEINQRIDGYGELKKKTFMEAFDAINQNFQDIFAELSHGHGKLELEHPEAPFDGGLVIRAQPRDKKMQRIEALSGGEKSLTALSFVFAFQRYAPAPFYAFDEVDMMLDGANAERLAQMVKRQSSTAQFVVVSLRRPMIENSDHAIGVSLRSDGYSRVVGIQEIKIPDLPEVHAVGA